MQKPTIPKTQPIYPISVIAEILKVHQRTLRIYDEEGLLSPKRSPKNRRLYSLEDTERGKFIQYLTKEMGINLAGIKIILNMLDKLQIELENRIDFISKIAEELNITPEMQKQNRLKLSKRGRKKKVTLTN